MGAEKKQTLGCVLALVLFAFLASTAAAADTLPVKLAITFDDLPWVGELPAEGSAADAILRIAAVLNVHAVPATGFVICDTAAESPVPVDTWVSWGFTVGNHTAAHRDLNQVPVNEWLEDVARCDKYLQKYGDARIPYLRFPLLHQGDTVEKRNVVRHAVDDMGLRVAHVTVDTSEWILTQVHAAAVQQGDAILRRETGEAFIRHIVDAIEHADAVAKRKLDRPVPQVLLLHANSLVEDYLDELLLTLRGRGVEFVSLPEALSDPAYAHEDAYAGRKGLSWLYRMTPLSLDDVAWDDAEAARITARFSKALKGEDGAFERTNVTAATIDTAWNTKLDAVIRKAGESERLRSLLVSHRGKRIAEVYFNGAGADAPANLKSVTKTLTSALVGVALRNGWIENVDEPVAKYLPEISRTYPDKAGVTIRQLLTMSSGLGAVDYGVIQQRQDWVAAVLAAPLDSENSGTFSYDTPVLQLLTALIETTSGRSSERVAKRELLAPISAEMDFWRNDPQGIAFGGNDAYMTPRDMLAFGELFLMGGKRYGTQVLPAAFVAESTQRQLSTGMDFINHGTFPVRGYGYLWWLIELGGRTVDAALGHGGQMILVSPEQELVVVVTSRWPGPSSTAHYEHVAQILDKELFPLFTPR